MALKWKDRVKLLAVALLLASISACGDSFVGPEMPTDVTYAVSLGIDLSRMVRNTSGVYYETRVPGTTGRVQVTDRITGEFKGYLPDGFMFSSGKFTAQQLNGLIPGLSDGIVGMQKGETRIIVIPSDLAYGNFPPDGSGIPKNSVLVFEVILTNYTA